MSSPENPIVLLAEKTAFSSTPLESADSYEAREGRPGSIAALESEQSSLKIPPSHSSSTGTDSSTHSRKSSNSSNLSSSINNHSSKKRSRKRRNHSSRSNLSSGSASTYKVLFSTASAYDKWMWMVLSLPLIALLVPLLVLLVSLKADFVRSQQTWVLEWSLILIIALYMMVLPKEVDVRSNGSIGIKTCLITYTFRDICRAYKADEGYVDYEWETLQALLRSVSSSGSAGRGQYKFATSTSDRVVIRRKGGLWDLIVSPHNVDDFLQAIDKVVTEDAVPVATTATTPVTAAVGPKKPDLSTV